MENFRFEIFEKVVITEKDKYMERLKMVHRNELLIFALKSAYEAGLSAARDAIIHAICDKCFREKLAEVLNIPKDCTYSESLGETKEAEE